MTTTDAEREVLAAAESMERWSHIDRFGEEQERQRLYRAIHAVHTERAAEEPHPCWPPPAGPPQRGPRRCLPPLELGNPNEIMGSHGQRYEWR